MSFLLFENSIAEAEVLHALCPEACLGEGTIKATLVRLIQIKEKQPSTPLVANWRTNTLCCIGDFDLLFNVPLDARGDALARVWKDIARRINEGELSSTDTAPEELLTSY